MSTIFCPFIKGNCKFECIFNNKSYDDNDVQNCELLSAVGVINSYVTDKLPKEHFDNIEKKLDTISSHTGSDQTESYEIKKILNEISRKISK